MRYLTIIKTSILAVLLLPHFCVAKANEIFTDVAVKAGIDFEYFHGATGDFLMMEVVGAGGGFLDYDNDGDLDIYMVQGALADPDKTLKDALIAPKHPNKLNDRLYRNDSYTDAKGNFIYKFTDVTEQSKLNATGYGFGLAVSDINRDGFVDIYVANYGDNQLWLNNGDGTFSDITASAGVNDNRWSVNANFFDVNNDGLPDLYVGNYVVHPYKNAKKCNSDFGTQDYCSPLAFKHTSDRLFINLGNNKFRNISVKSGFNRKLGSGLGSVAADFNGDGWQDLFVSNDGIENFLWINQGDETFVEEGLLAGVSVNAMGKAEASMGVDAADFDEDGDIDLFMTHLLNETNTLYLNDGTGWFDDQTNQMNLGVASKAFTGFGTKWFDYDNNGSLDVFIANGAVVSDEKQYRAGDKLPFKQANQLFKLTDKGVYQEISEQAGKAVTEPLMSRGLAAGDVDNDGDIDLLVANAMGPAQLLINNVGQDNAWIGVEPLLAKNIWIEGIKVGRLKPGVTKPSSIKDFFWRRSHTDGSYIASQDRRVLFGLTKDNNPQTIVVHWPDNSFELYEKLDAKNYHQLFKGQGQALKLKKAN